jgi:glycosyltransferase involved in cell wall biosynthesis
MRTLVAAGRPLRLHLVGDGPEADHVRTLVAELGLSDHVRFAGQLDEARTLEAIAASDILVLPSLMEGLPVVLMEAMALGKPVIASHVAGIPELVSPDTGRLFRPADWAQLASSIEALAADPALRRRLGEAGKAAVEAEFTAAKAAERMADLFGRAAHGGQRP